MPQGYNDPSLTKYITQLTIAKYYRQYILEADLTQVDRQLIETAMVRKFEPLRLVKDCCKLPEGLL